MAIAKRRASLPVIAILTFKDHFLPADREFLYLRFYTYFRIHDSDVVSLSYAIPLRNVIISRSRNYRIHNAFYPGRARVFLYFIIYAYHLHPPRLRASDEIAPLPMKKAADASVGIEFPQLAPISLRRSPVLQGAKVLDALPVRMSDLEIREIEVGRRDS